MDLTKAARDRWVWGQMVLLILVVVGAPVIPRTVNLGWADPILGLVDPMPFRLLGALIAILGLGEMIWGFRSLGKSLTPGVEPLPQAELAKTGAYAYVRHPIYFGVILALAGYTLFWSNWRLAMIAGGVSLLFFDGKAAVEERYLVERFPGYEEYRRQVPRLLPRGRG